MPNYLQRILTALVLAAFLALVLLVNQTIFGFGMGLICAVALWEYVHILKKRNPQLNAALYIAFGLAIYVVNYFTVIEVLPEKCNLVVLPIGALLLIRSLYKVKENFTATIALEFFGYAYLVFPFVMMNQLVFMNGSFDTSIIWLILLLTASSDVGAYVVGVNFGKRPLAKTISPKKSIEGFVGGILITLLVGYLLSGYFPEFTLWQLMAVSLLVAVMGTYGDLLESKIKRDYQVKDSSKLLPGHGGFLDRLDSIIFSTAFVYLCLLLMQ